MMGKLPLERTLGLDDLSLEDYGPRRQAGEPVDIGGRYVPHVTFHRFSGAQIEAGPYCVALNTHNDLNGPEGSWQVDLKGSTIPTGLSFALRSVDWLNEVSPGDWVVIELGEGQRVWPIMVGIVDRVHRSIAGTSGGRHVTYTISGRDHGKTLTSTDIIVLPQFKEASAIDLGRDLQPFYRRIDRAIRDAGPDGVSPSEILPRLLYFFLGHDTREGSFERGAAPVWHVPPSLQFRPARFADASLIDRKVIEVQIIASKMGGKGLPFGDLLEVATEPLDGRLVMREMFEGIPDGMTLWSFLAGYCNTEINEVFMDLLPTGYAVDRTMAASDYWGPEPGAHSWVPTLVLRRRPFPSESALRAFAEGFMVDPDARASGIDRWNRLPWSMLDERQLVQDEVSRHDQDMANFFLATPHASYGMHPYTMALGSSGRGKLPVVVKGSPARHGWRRRMMTSPFLPSDLADPNATYFVWTQLLRDWYGHNPDLLSGTVRTGRAMLGIRAGERLTILRDGARREEAYYVEAVAHDFRVAPSGSITTSSTLTLTRGSSAPNGGYRTFAQENAGEPAGVTIPVQEGG